MISCPSAATFCCCLPTCKLYEGPGALYYEFVGPPDLLDELQLITDLVK